MRSNLLALRLNSMSILHTHKLIADKLDLKVIANEFFSNNDRRKSTFGRF